MSLVLRPLATFLTGINYTVSETEYQAVPFFNFYTFSGKDLCHSELKTAIKDAKDAAARPQYANFPESIVDVVDKLVTVGALHWK